MRILVLALVIASSGLGATAAFLYQELKTERERTRAVIAHAQLLEQERNRMQQQVGNFLAMSSMESNVPTLPADALAARNSVPPESNQAAAQPALAIDERNTARIKAAREYFNSPAMAKLRMAGMKQGVRMMNADFIKDMNLTPQQAEQFVEILAGQHSNVMQNATQENNGNVDWKKASEEAKVKTDAALLALLGPESFSQYEKYQKSMPERMQVTGLGHQLDAMNIPLNPDQRKQLVTAMVEEKDRIPAPATTSDSTNPFAGVSDAMVEWKEDYDQRVRERVTRILTPEQIKQYDEIYTLQNSMMKMARQEAAVSAQQVQ